MRCEIGIHKADWSFQEDKIQHRCLRKMIYYIGRWLLVVVWDFKSQLSVFQSIQLTLRSPNPMPFSFCDLGCSALFRDIFWLNGFVREIFKLSKYEWDSKRWKQCETTGWEVCGEHCMCTFPSNQPFVFFNPTSLQCRMCLHNYVRTIPVKFLGLYPWL